MTIRWALLGTGRHAERSAVAPLKTAAGGELVAVLSRDSARGAAFAKKHGIAKIHTSFEELLRDPGIDAIYDATPDGLHAGHAVAAAQAGKHALIEKPLAISVAECARAIAACKRHRVKLGVVFQQRHEAIHQEVKAMVAAGTVGEVLMARVQIALRPMARSAQRDPPQTDNWRTDPAMRPGGIVMGIADHAFDTLAYLMGQAIDEVSAFTDATRLDPPNERVATLLLKLSGGAVGCAIASARTPFARRPFEIHGTKASLAIENSYVYLAGVGDDPRPTLEIVGENGRGIRHFAASDCFRLEIEQFNRAIEDKGEPMTTAEEGLRAQAVIEAAYASMRHGAAKVADFLPKPQ